MNVPENTQELLETLQDLTLQGLDRHVDVPMVIVCGESGAAKVTTIETITGIDLPKEYLDNKFTMEFVLRGARDRATRKVSAVPRTDRTDAEKLQITRISDEIDNDKPGWGPYFNFLFSRAIIELRQFPNLTMDDVLRVEITDTHFTPRTPRKLMIVRDLPAWNLTTWDSAHLSNHRGIVVIAYDDLQDLKIPKSAGRLLAHLGGGQSRILGVFVARLELTSGEFQQVLSISRNQCRGYQLKHGWHVLKHNVNDCNPFRYPQSYCGQHPEDKWEMHSLQLLQESAGCVSEMRSGILNDHIHCIFKDEIPCDVGSILTEIEECLSKDETTCGFQPLFARHSLTTPTKHVCGQTKKCDILRRSLRELKRFDTRPGVASPSIASSTTELAFTPDESVAGE